MRCLSSKSANSSLLLALLAKVTSVICGNHNLTFAAREKVVGWYSTGPRLREADLDVNQLMSQYVESPLLVICEVQVSSKLPVSCHGLH